MIEMKIITNLKIKAFNFLIRKIEDGNRFVTISTKIDKILNLIDLLKPVLVSTELIRFGKNSDGGYLIPNDLDGIEGCFSPGVDKESSFEIDCYKNGMSIFLADYSIDKPNIIDKAIQYSHLKKFIGTITSDKYLTLDAWVSQSLNSTSSDLLLQMDIEGSEYEVILSTSNEILKRFRIIVVEFHDLNLLWDPFFFKIANSVFQKILDTHHCVHIHPNNSYDIYKYKNIEIPQIAEFTFIRKDRVDVLGYANSFPHKLDFDNTDRSPIALPKLWYGIN